MRFLEELLFLSFLRGIGRSTVNDGFVPWLRWWTLSENRKNTPLSAAEEWLRQTGKTPLRPEMEEAERKVQHVLDWLKTHGEVRACTVFDEAYPARLNIMGAQRPPVLYIRGRMVSPEGRGTLTEEGQVMEVLSSPALAVIGSRWPGEYSLVNGPAFTQELVKRSGMSVVSGLARGCDRMGHLAAIQNDFPTIAVMPCGPDTVVPEINRDLAEQIISGHGFLLTEYPPGTPPAEYRYVERDRITAALSSAAVVIECGIKSGTMQTVRAALSFGRPVACWDPKGAERTGFEGNRYMIEQLGVFRLCDAVSQDLFLNRVRQSGQSFDDHEEQLSVF